MIESDLKSNSWEIFNRIAHRYDFLNRFLSFRQDVRWRKAVIRIMTEHRINPKRYFDIATGTCDQILELCRRLIPDTIVGMDMSENMLRLGKSKIHEKGPGKPVFLIQGDGMQIPFRDRYFDCITISFGIRNFADLEKSLNEMHRILVQGGHLFILEFSLPYNKIFRFFYLFYFRRILPKLGGMISGDKMAYGYLNKTVEDLNHPVEVSIK